MPLDTSIPLQIKSPEFNPLQTALQVAQYRMANAQGNALQQQIGANQAASQAIQANTDANGNTNWDAVKGALAANPAGAYNLPQLNASLIANQKSGVDLNNSQIDNYKKALGFMTQQFATLDPQDPNFNAKVLTIGADAVKLGHIDPNMVVSTMTQIPQDPNQRNAWFQQKLASMKDAAGQLDSLTPKPTQVDTGGALQYTDTNPITNSSIVGQSFPKTLDPATASTPTPAYVNGQPGNIPRSQFAAGGDQPPPIPTIAQPAGMPASSGTAAPMPSGPAPASATASAPGAPAGFVPTGPAMGVQGSNDGNVDTVNKHWSQLSNDAQNAQTNIGLAQNIKAYADQALTGKQGDKLAAVNGILSILGVKGQTDLNTATDLLNKNMARLSLTSRSAAGGTDAAGALATAANPHGTMTAAAIKDAADQVIGAQQMALAEQKVLQPYKLGNDVAGYQQAQTKFNQAADPRIWQFANMSPQQRATFKSSMSPADQHAFSAKIRTLESIGAIQ